MTIEELTVNANNGNCASQCLLGLSYLYGTDEVEINYERARQWLSAAADKGSSRAIASLGSLYAEGLGVPKDIGLAIRLLERAAVAEFFAAIDLARIYATGADVPEDPSRALKWYSVAVEMADIEPCEELEEARCYIASFALEK